MKSFKQFMVESIDTNSMGAPIYPTPEGIANFWKWFGRSRIVDSQGRPLVVFHTSVADFNRFKRDPSDIGMHFGTQGQAADRYHVKSAADPYGPELSGVKHNTLPVYLKITNPLRMDDVGRWSGTRLAKALASIPEFANDGVSGYLSTFEMQKLIRSKGYDGVVYTNKGESSGADVYRKKFKAAEAAFYSLFPDYDYHHVTLADRKLPEFIAMADAEREYHSIKLNSTEDSWIVFDPKQIKSTIGNNGNFKPTSAIITESE